MYPGLKKKETITFISNYEDFARVTVDKNGLPMPFRRPVQEVPKTQD